ncbi:hypothetical protein BH20VER3_BH20VER3_07970 [soil metagenome]
MKVTIAEAKEETEIARCYPFVRQLRTYFADETIFVAPCRPQGDGGM